MNFCKNCKHIRMRMVGIEYARCAAIPDLVSGDGSTYCSTARSVGACGKEGKLFEQKVTATRFVVSLILDLKRRIEALKSNLPTTKE